MNEYKKILNNFNTDFICAGIMSILYTAINPKTYPLIIGLLIINTIHIFHCSVKETERLLKRAENQIENLEFQLDKMYKERYD